MSRRNPKFKSSKPPIKKVPVYLTEREYAAVADMAAANNISPGKCVKTAALQKIGEVYEEVAKRMAAAEPEQLHNPEAVEAGDTLGDDADVSDDVSEEG